MTEVLIPLYEGVTHLDFTGPRQFLSTLTDFDVITASLDGDPMVSNGLTFSNLTDLETVERCGALPIPGDLGCIPAIENARYKAAVRRLAENATHLTSVCTGSLVLGATRLLKGRRASCHWAWRNLSSAIGATADDARIVCDGNVLTGGGDCRHRLFARTQRRNPRQGRCPVCPTPSRICSRTAA
ncbi:DJ-1/PfpI family protein [Paraburkholderia caribensis]|uniref:DJ-1/PfpI family protein n=1 Tax=Paraburkholderia caribensis TaxID=75105 RepID=UPI0018D327BA